MIAPSPQHSAGKKLTTNEAAAYLGIAASTLSKMRLTGGGPIFLKLGFRRVVYDVADLEAWAASRRRQSTSHVAPPAEVKGDAR
jgi:predicted DNA-binding transcriptional regulator AlpA